MNKEELIHKMAAVIAKIKEETNKGVIKEHTINTVVNWKTCEETGQAATLVCGTKFEYSDAVLNHWKEQFEASEYRIRVNRSQLFITFIVDYKEEEMKDE